MSTYAENSAVSVAVLPRKSGDADESVCTVNVNLDGKMRLCGRPGWFASISKDSEKFLNGGRVRNLTIA